MAKKLSPFGIDMLKTCGAFGLTLGLQIYIIGVLAGGWLDKKLGTEPAFLLAGILIAVFISFYRLISDFKKALEQEERRDAERRAQNPVQYINYDEVFADEAEADENKDEKEEEEEL